MQFSLRLCEYITFWSRLVRKLSSEYPVSVTHLLHGAISGWAVRGSDGSAAATQIANFCWDALAGAGRRAHGAFTLIRVEEL